MKTSDKGIVALMTHEGVVPAPYLDSVNVLTYGVGHTKAAGSPDPASLPKGMPSDLDSALGDVFEVFGRDIEKYEAAVDKAITVPVEQHEFDAAVSFHYNTGAIATASWVKTLNKGDRETAAAQIMNWTKPPEIIPRREDEQTLFATGKYPTGNINVWGVDANSKLTWKVVRTLSPEEAISAIQNDKDIDKEVADKPIRDKAKAKVDSVKQAIQDKKKPELAEGYLSEHFKASEFACNHCSLLPDDGMAPALIDLLEDLRSHFGKPVTINSGYRCTVHNANVGGAKNSQHLKGTAADVVVSGVSPSTVYAWADENNPTGGVGKYNSFTHIDVRSGKARWQIAINITDKISAGIVSVFLCACLTVFYK